MSIGSRQGELFETFYLVTIRTYLCVPSYASNSIRLVGVENTPLRLQAGERAMRLLERTHRASSVASPHRSLHARFEYRIGQLAAKFALDIRRPSELFQPFASHRSKAPL